MKYIESKNGYFYKIKNNTTTRISKAEYLKKVKKGGAVQEESGGGGGGGGGGGNSRNGSNDRVNITTIDSYISTQREVLKEQLDKYINEYQKMEDKYQKMDYILTMYKYIKSYLDKYTEYKTKLIASAQKGKTINIAIEKVNYTLLINEQIKRLQEFDTIQYSNSNKEILANLISLYKKLLDICNDIYNSNNEPNTNNLFDLKVKLIKFLYPLVVKKHPPGMIHTSRTSSQVSDNKKHIMGVFDLTEEEFVELKKRV